MNVDYDVIIIGAGPAGTACALALHGNGLKVALIEKEAFPRDKVCGDAIPGKAFKAMSKIRADWGDKMKTYADKTAITSTSIFLSKANTINYNWKLFSYNSKRIDFDNFLFQLVAKDTDTVVLEKKFLEKISDEPSYCHCFFSDGSSLKTSIVVGCDGSHSVVKRQLLKSNFPDRHSVFAVRAYYKGITNLRDGYNEVHLIKEAYGYFWIFPLKDGWANVGFGIVKNDIDKKSPTNIRKILEEITQSSALANRFTNATLEGKVYGFPLPIWTKKKKVSGNRFLLCGDAASLVEPLQGHGIDTAMSSGIIAAEQIINCCKNNIFCDESMRDYDKKIYDEIGKELSRNYLIVRFLLRFPFFITIISKIHFSQNFIDWVIRKLKL